MNTTIDYSTQDWDNITIIVRGECATILKLKGAETALELNRELTVAWFQDHEGSLDISIDGSDYTFTKEAWEGILSVTNQWLDRYSADQYPELFVEEPQSAEVISLFG